ncbi:hypothetical protein MAJ_09845, partial [Metarhizium majus ARSEF 297]
MDKVQRRASRVLGRLCNSRRAASSPAAWPGTFDPSADRGRDGESPTFAKYSSYEPLATCGVVESWLVTAEERKRAAKKARKNRKFSLVKDPDQLW